MPDDRLNFNTRAVRPMECLREGWGLIKADYWLFLGIDFVGMLIAQFAPLGILMGPMMCGIYFGLLRKLRGKSVQFGDLFKGFDHFLQSLIATLLMMIPLMVLLVPAYIALIVAWIATMPKPGPGGGPPPPPGPNELAAFLGGYALFILVVLVVSILVTTAFFFTYPLIVDRRLSGTQAVGTSFRAVPRNLGGVLGLVILTNLLSFAGSLACCVGVYFVMPLTFAATVVAYRKVFPKVDEWGPAGPLDPNEEDYGPLPEA